MKKVVGGGRENKCSLFVEIPSAKRQRSKGCNTSCVRAKAGGGVTRGKRHWDARLKSGGGRQ